MLSALPAIPANSQSQCLPAVKDRTSPVVAGRASHPVCSAAKGLLFPVLMLETVPASPAQLELLFVGSVTPLTSVMLELLLPVAPPFALSELLFSVLASCAACLN